MTVSLPNPWVSESAPKIAGEAVAVLVMPPAPEAATVVIPESAALHPALDKRAETAGTVESSPVPAAFSNSVLDGVCASSPAEMLPSATLANAPFGTAAVTVNRDDTNAAADISTQTQYIVELFSDYARRRCMNKISPPLPKVERNIDGIALGAVTKALDPYLHPRDLDLDPPPLFLRKPRPAFLRALFQLAGDAR